jgi:hypothetical protein
MQHESMTSQGPASRKILVSIVSIVINYFGYAFLTFPILIMFSVLVFDYTVVFGTKMPFMEYLTFLPGLADGQDVHIDSNMVLMGYSIVTTLFWIISKIVQGVQRAVKRILRKAHPENYGISEQRMVQITFASVVGMFTRKLFIVSLPVTAVFVTAFTAMPFSPLIPRANLLGLVFVLFVFYVITIFSVAVHSGIDTLSQLVAEWGSSFPSE